MELLITLLLWLVQWHTGNNTLAEQTCKLTLQLLLCCRPKQNMCKTKGSSGGQSFCHMFEVTSRQP